EHDDHETLDGVVDGRLADWKLLVGDAPEPPRLASQMHRAWIAFVRTGHPNHPGLPEWPPYDLDQRPTLDFDTHTRLRHDPAGITRAAWSQP
ncbi:MAG: hypothetical protein ACE5GB_09085, partial [Acidimicrobiales bacterium]